MNTQEQSRNTQSITKSFEDRIREMAEESILKLFRDGQMFAPVDYSQRVKVPADLVRAVYATINQEVVLDKIRATINDLVATKICAAMVEEITTDVKKVLSHEPTRLRLRMVVAQEIDAIRVGK